MRYLKVTDNCGHCDEELLRQRSDDAATYFTILILGHIIAPLLLIIETHFSPAYCVSALTGIPLGDRCLYLTGIETRQRGRNWMGTLHVWL
ncbi:MAG: DUF983 domain-containing protein [bacterium]|nr:DUF983 domain-containing protein [bacterium]